MKKDNLSNAEKVFKKYHQPKVKAKTTTEKPQGTYCPKVSGCCYNHLPSKKKVKQEEQA